MTTEFFMPMHPPTVTHHDKKITVKNGKAIMYDSTELKATKSKLTSHLAEHAPERPYGGAVRLIVKWCFDCLLYTSPSPREVEESRMPSSA